MKQDDDMDARRTGALARQPIEDTGEPPGDPVTAGLQRLFAAVAEEPIPDEFLTLLDEIDKRAGELPAARKEDMPRGDMPGGDSQTGEAQ